MVSPPTPSPSSLSAEPRRRPAQGLHRSERLLKRRQFLSTQKRGVKVHGRHLMVLAAPGTADLLRLGVTASKKVGGAVQRNRAKRLLREAFRRLKGRWPGGVDLVVVARASLAQQGLDEAQRDLAAAVDQALRRLQHKRRARGR